MQLSQTLIERLSLHVVKNEYDNEKLLAGQNNLTLKKFRQNGNRFYTFST